MSKRTSKNSTVAAADKAATFAKAGKVECARLEDISATAHDVKLCEPAALAALLRRGAAAIETPGDLTADERAEVAEDLAAAAEAVEQHGGR